MKPHYTHYYIVPPGSEDHRLIVPVATSKPKTHEWFWRLVWMALWAGIAYLACKAI